MKVLIVQNTNWLKRNPAQQHHLAEMLSLRGHEIRVVDFEILWRTQGRREFFSKRKIFNDVSKIYSDAKVMVIRPSILKIPLLDYVSVFYSHKKEIERQVKEFAPDVIVSLGVISYVAGRAAKRSDTPFIYYWIDVSHRLIPFKPLQPIGWIMEHRALKLADRILVINRKLREYVIGMGAPPELTQVLGAGVDFRRFSPSVSGDAVRKLSGINEDEVVLFFMGWLYKFSGLKEVALRLARLENDNVKLLIVGEGDLYDELRQIQERYGMSGRLILAGKKAYSEIPVFLAASDICLLPAYPTEKIMQDIVPIKMYEYMAMAKPVISSRLPGVVKEFGEDNGVVYVDKPQDVIEKAMELIRSGNLDELGRKARSFTERRSWNNITNEFEKILEETIKKRSLCARAKGSLK